MTETEQTLRQHFTAFLQAMYDWETEANRVDEEEVEKKKTLFWEDFCKQQTELRIPIYKEYITERERKYGGAQYTCHGFPPNYDPSKESITEVQITGKKASIFYLQRVCKNELQARVQVQTRRRSLAIRYYQRTVFA